MWLYWTFMKTYCIFPSVAGPGFIWQLGTWSFADNNNTICRSRGIPTQFVSLVLVSSEIKWPTFTELSGRKWKQVVGAKADASLPAAMIMRDEPGTHTNLSRTWVSPWRTGAPCLSSCFCRLNWHTQAWRWRRYKWSLASAWEWVLPRWSFDPRQLKQNPRDLCMTSSVLSSRQLRTSVCAAVRLTRCGSGMCCCSATCRLTRRSGARQVDLAAASPRDSAPSGSPGRAAALLPLQRPSHDT